MTTASMKASQAATSLRSEIWKDRPFPVDPVLIAKELGISVKEAELPEDVYAALIKDPGKDPLIVLSASDSKNRKRFSCAHEIGHYIYRTFGDGDAYEYIDLRSPDSSAGTNPEEIFANQFAACLLMPEDEVRNAQRKGLPSFLMARYFGVSEEAINIRMGNLRCNG